MTVFWIVLAIFVVVLILTVFVYMLKKKENYNPQVAQSVGDNYLKMGSQLNMGQKKTVTEATAVTPLNVVNDIATGGEVAKMADAYGYSVKEYNGIQNNIVQGLEKI